MTTAAADLPVTLVTGANKDIGAEIVRRLTEAGPRVYLAARDEDRGRTAAEGVSATFVQLDTTDNDAGITGAILGLVWEVYGAWIYPTHAN